MLYSRHKCNISDIVAMGKNMKVAIVGFGRMGKNILSVIEEMGDEAAAIIDPVANDGRVTHRVLNAESVKDADVVIDFSHPSSAMDNMIMYSHLGIPAVIGTTGWYDEKDKLVSLLGEDAKILYSGNFSIGVAMFLKIARRASELINKAPEYDVSMREVHHTGKADSPSGTALMLADQILAGMDRKDEILLGNSEGRIKPNALQITSERVGFEPGLHEITFDSPADTITLTHHARSREGFARGAVAVARWLIGTDRKGLMTLDDYICELLGE